MSRLPCSSSPLHLQRAVRGHGADVAQLILTHRRSRGCGHLSTKTLRGRLGSWRRKGLLRMPLPLPLPPSEAGPRRCGVGLGAAAADAHKKAAGAAADAATAGKWGGSSAIRSAIRFGLDAAAADPRMLAIPGKSDRCEQWQPLPLLARANKFGRSSAQRPAQQRCWEWWLMLPPRLPLGKYRRDVLWGMDGKHARCRYEREWAHAVNLLRMFLCTPMFVLLSLQPLW